MVALTLSPEGARRSRIRAQLLDGRSTNSRGVAAVAWFLVGVQAQDQASAGFSIRARGTGVAADDIRRALAESRSIVLLWSLRGTRHFHHVDDVRWLIALLGPVFGKPGRRARQLGIAGDVGDNAVRVLRAALGSKGPLTRAEVKELLARHGVDPSGQAAVHILHRAAMAGILCIVTGSDGQERYVLLDDWVPPAKTLTTEEGEAELARRYLAAYGPARPADFAAWSGLGISAGNRAWAALAGELSEVTVLGDLAGQGDMTAPPWVNAPPTVTAPHDLTAWPGITSTPDILGTGRPAWILSSHRKAVAPAASHPQPLRLVGGYDTLILGYADRSLHIRPDDARRLNPGGGIVRPVAVSDGQVVATWRHQRSPQRVEVALLRELSEAEQRDVAREVSDIGRFLGSDPALVISPLDSP